jgi:predicted amidophosphoribosyltransferase
VNHDQEETGDVRGPAVMFRCAQHGDYSVGHMDSTLCPTCRKPMSELSHRCEVCGADTSREVRNAADPVP